jgi:hypothetical protein
MTMSNATNDNKNEQYKLIVNKKEKESPSDWVVNMLIPDGGEDPEITPSMKADLDLKAAPQGIKKFQTRKPKTNPG